MMTKEYTHSDLAVPPGEYLEEVLSELGMAKDELARRMNRPASKLSAIFTGDKAITPDTALQLEKVVGVPAHIWTGLEAEYRLTLARNLEVLEDQRLRGESCFIAKYCYSELVVQGFVAKKTKAPEKVQELQRFFGVTSLTNIPSLKRYQAAFRQGAGIRSHEATATCLRIGEFQGQRTVSSPFNKSLLESVLPLIRSMTLQVPERFEAKLRQTLLDVGVVLVLCPHLPKTYLQGATFWLRQNKAVNKAVIMLTIRGSWADIFWFSLFHEIGHILLHGKKMVFLEEVNKTCELGNFEKEANTFAVDVLIPPGDYKSFLDAGSFYSRDIISFARHLGIDPGIVVGRLQHDDKILRSWHNNLRTRYRWENL